MSLFSSFAGISKYSRSPMMWVLNIPVRVRASRVMTRAYGRGPAGGPPRWAVVSLPPAVGIAWAGPAAVRGLGLVVAAGADVQATARVSGNATASETLAVRERREPQVIGAFTPGCWRLASSCLRRRGAGRWLPELLHQRLERSTPWAQL